MGRVLLRALLPAAAGIRLLGITLSNLGDARDADAAQPGLLDL